MMNKIKQNETSRRSCPNIPWKARVARSAVCEFMELMSMNYVNSLGFQTSPENLLKVQCVKLGWISNFYIGQSKHGARKFK